MKNLIEYKGYLGSVEFSSEDEVFFGKVQGIRSLISYEGNTASELIQDFHNAVDDYLSLCKEENKDSIVKTMGDALGDPRDADVAHSFLYWISWVIKLLRVPSSAL